MGYKRRKYSKKKYYASKGRNTVPKEESGDGAPVRGRTSVKVKEQMAMLSDLEERFVAASRNDDEARVYHRYKPRNRKRAGVR